MTHLWRAVCKHFDVAKVMLCMVSVSPLRERSRYVLPVRVRNLAGLSLLFLLTALSMGVIISTIASTQMEAMQLSFLILLPSILLSGFVFPIQSIPQPIQTMTYLIPARYFIEILRGIILRGADLSALWPEAVALMVYTAALLVLGAARFKRRLD